MNQIPPKFLKEATYVLAYPLSKIIKLSNYPYYANFLASPTI